MKKIIIIPTYNEKNNIKILINKIIKLYNSKFNILIVDDNSPDGTLEQVRLLKKKYKFIDFISRKKKLGIGSAHKIALKYVYKQKFQIAITMDADGTHDPRSIKKFLEKIKDNDLITTNRFLKKNSLEQWPIHRRILTGFRHHLIKFVLRLPIDSSGAYRCYDLKKIKIQDILKAKDNGYSFFWESMFILYYKNYKIYEEPIKLPFRTIGASKMRFKDIYNALVYLFVIYKKNFL
jgi:dolichol-phosphate mannosyltransferase